MKQFDNVWCKNSKHFIVEEEPLSDSNHQLDELVQVDLSSLTAGLDINQSSILDKHLLKQLTNNLEHLNLDDMFAESIDLPSKCDRTQLTELDCTESSLAKFKNSDVINTRTGLKYKAPMRGGHSNPAQRHMIGANLATSTLSGNQAATNANTQSMNQANMMRHDSFRARAPNTSRPPSLHVDEFYRLENANARQQQQQQQQSQTLNQAPNEQPFMNSTNTNLVNIDTSSSNQTGKNTLFFLLLCMIMKIICIRFK